MTFIDPHDATGRSPRGCLAGFAIIALFIIGAATCGLYWLTHI